jgi:hypothetical protein
VVIRWPNLNNEKYDRAVFSRDDLGNFLNTVHGQTALARLYIVRADYARFSYPVL